MFQRAIFFCLFALAQVVVASAANEAAYQESLSLRISYNPEHEGSFTVILKNTSDDALRLVLNTQEVEGVFLIEGGEAKRSFYSRNYLLRLVTSIWFSGSHTLNPGAEVKWAVPLGELVHLEGIGEPRVTRERLAGRSVSLRLDRLAVLPGGRQKDVPVKLTSNTVAIPKT